MLRYARQPSILLSSSRCFPAYPERASCKGNIGFESFIEPGDRVRSDEVKAIADWLDERS